jgi:nucleotide-binding universal stress UspA family protein
MTYKDILVYADAAKAAEARLDVAAKLAADHGAHLVALHVAVPPYIFVDAGMVVPPGVIEWQEQYQEQQTAAARKAVDAATRRSGQEMEWRVDRGDVVDVALLHSRYADVVVVSQSGAEEGEDAEADLLPEAIVMGAGRPALVVPRFGRFPKLGENVLVAWNRTREATRAVHDALPILIRAKAVTVMEVNPRATGTPHIPGADIATHLARHGVKAEVTAVTGADIEVGDMILSRIVDLGADMLVMGAYGHSRLREFAFGGVTRHLLQHMTVPVLMSH